MTRSQTALLLACAVLAVAAILDGYSTTLFLARTWYSEGDPLFGHHPSTLRLFSEGTLLISAEILVAWWVSLRRSQAAWVFVALFLGQASYQISLYYENMAAALRHWH